MTLAEFKEFIIASLNLEGLRPDMIADDAPLFGDGLGLDSVDALELIVAMEKKFGLKIRGDEIDRKAFATAASLLQFVERRVEAQKSAG